MYSRRVFKNHVQMKMGKSNELKRAMPMPIQLAEEESMPNDFLVGVGVLVAVKNPVSTCVVVVTVIPFELVITEVTVLLELCSLENCASLSYSIPPMITPCLSINMFF
jgi:hypothetical protein